MDPIRHLNPIEQNLCNKADLAEIPIAGNIELLPLCNMNCKMCFAKMTKEEMEAYAPMHSYEEWLKITEAASKAGTIFMLLTGGEPFLYPGIKELYMGLKKQGYIISINTNGTMITEEIVEWLALDKPRRLNITLYGSSDEIYEKLCGNPKGFTQVMKAVQLLKEKEISIKFNCSITPYNIEDLENIYGVAEKLEIPIEMGFYMFPPVRANNIKNKNYRMNPENAAEARFRIEKLRYGDSFNEHVLYSLEQYRKYEQKEFYRPGYTCRSGHSVYWINYDGMMSACSFTNDFQENVFEKDFVEIWECLKVHVRQSEMSKKCHYCKEQILCGRCAAAAVSETGSILGVPEYYCKLTKRYIELLTERESIIKCR